MIKSMKNINKYSLVERVKKCTTTLLLVGIFTGCSTDNNMEIGMPQGKESRVSQLKIDNQIVKITYNTEGYITDYGNDKIAYNVDNKVTGTGGITYGYDDQGKLNQANKTAFTYDDKNRTATATNEDAKATFEYNDKGQLESSLFYGGPNAVPISYGGPNASPFGYGGPNANPAGYGGPNALPTHKISFVYDTKGNIAQVLTKKNTGSGSFTDFYIATYTYDDFKNPNVDLLKSTGIEGAFTPIAIFRPTLGFFYQFFNSPNNLVSIEVQALETRSTQHTEFIYSYKDTGYPTSADISFSDFEGNIQTSKISWNYSEN